LKSQLPWSNSAGRFSAPPIELRYYAPSETILDFGPAADIGKIFVNFQQDLY
jgi:hypothetical protein